MSLRCWIMELGGSFHGVTWVMLEVLDQQCSIVSCPSKNERVAQLEECVIGQPCHASVPLSYWGSGACEPQSRVA